MVLKVSSKRPVAVPVDLGGGAVWRLRPATSFEVQLAIGEAQKLVLALAAGQEAADEVALIFGDDVSATSFSDPAWRTAACERLSLYALAKQCSEGWDGVIGDDDQPLACDDAGIMLALRDATICQRVSEAVNISIFEERAEGNGSAASPSGGAAADQNTAQAAESETLRVH